MTAKQLFISLLQGSALCTAVFILLLKFKQRALEHCGVKGWHFVVVFAVSLFLVPMYGLKAALSPIAVTLRAQLLQLISMFSFSSNKAAPVETSAYNTVYRYLLLIWLGGVLVYAVRKCIQFMKTAEKMKKRTRPASERVLQIFTDRVLADPDMRKSTGPGKAKLCYHNGVFSPLVFGFWKKTIALPENIIEDYDDDEVYLMLRHEAVHILHHDSTKKLLLLLVCGLNWFNPFMYMLKKNMDESMEQLCDFDTFIDKNDDYAHFLYSEILMAVAENLKKHRDTKAPTEGTGAMPRRIDILMKPPGKPNPRYAPALAIVVCAIVCLGAVLFAVPGSVLPVTAETGFHDVGRPSEPILWNTRSTPINDEFCNLSEQSEIVFEQNLLSSTVNYLSATFATDTTSIWLTLLSESSDVLVYLYNAENPDYPLMQKRLEQSANSQVFTGLIGTYTYLLGLLVDEDTDEPVSIIVSEHRIGS